MDIFDFLTDPFGSPDPEKQDRFLQGVDERVQAGRQGVQRSQQEAARIRKYAEAVGETPPEQEEGLFWKTLDALDTPKQWMVGNLGWATGAKDFEGLTRSEATTRAMELDSGIGDLLRDSTLLDEYAVLNPIKENGFLRGAVGFLGDVVFDPLTYATFGTSGFAKAGGLGLAKAAKVGKLGENGLEILNRVADKKTTDLLSEASKMLGTSVDDLPADLVAKYKTLGRTQASEPFRALGMLRQDARVKSAAKGLDDVDSIIQNEIQDKARKISLDMGIDVGDDPNILDTLNTLIQKPALRVQGPFAGSSVMGRIPLLGDEIEIPLVTKASQALFSKLADGYYGLPVKVQNIITKGASDNPDSLFWKAADVAGKSLAGAGVFARTALEPLSSRIQSSGEIFGSSASKDAVTEHVRARGGLELISGDEADIVLGDLKDLPMRDDIYASIVYETDAFGQKFNAFKKANQKAEKHLKLNDLQMEAKRDEYWNQTLEGVRTKYNSITPGSGDQAVAAMDKVSVLFDSLAQKEKQAGILDRVVEGYIARNYKAPGGISHLDVSDEMKEQLKSLFGGVDGSDMRLKRVFESFEEAKMRNFTPVTDLKEILAGRLYAHKIAMADKEFMERLVYQRSLTPEAYRKLNALSISEVSALRGRALQLLNQFDVPQEAKAAAEGKGAFMVRGGSPLTEETYKGWENALQDPSSVGPKAYVAAKQEANSLVPKLYPDEYQAQVSQIKALRDQLKDPSLDKAAKGAIRTQLKDVLQNRVGLNFGEEELKRIRQSKQIYEDTLQMIPTRMGESQFARAGATTLEELLGRKIKGKNKDEFWDGLLPQGFAEAYREATRGKSLLASMADRLRKEKKDPMGDILYRAASGLDWWRKISQKMLTLPYPAYWARNIGNNQLAGLKSISTLGEALNPMKVYNYHRLFRDKTFKVMNKAGEEITGDMLQNEFRQMGLSSSETMTQEFMKSYVEAFEASADMMGRKLPQTKLLKKQKDELERMNRFKRFTKATMDFGHSMEGFGRTFLYTNLRMKGWDPSSAAAEAHKLLIDYKMGRTQFERQFMTPTFFFYAFSRGNITNQVVSMLEKPGSLTNKLAVRNNIGEMFIDPENYNRDEYDEAEMQSFRTSQQGGKFLGTNPETGLPRILQGVGLDFEEMSKYSSALDPLVKGSNGTWNDIMSNVGDSSSAAFQVALSQLNPLFKNIMEVLGFKKNLYFDRPITDDTLRKIPAWERDMPNVLHAVFAAPGNALNALLPIDVWEKLDKGTKAALGGKDNKDGTITINPYAMAAIVTALPGASRFLATRSQLTSPGVAGKDKLSRLFSGIRVSEMDPQKSIAYSDARRLRDWAETRDIPITQREYQEDTSLTDEGEEDAD